MVRERERERNKRKDLEGQIESSWHERLVPRHLMGCCCLWPAASERSSISNQREPIYLASIFFFFQVWPSFFSRSDRRENERRPLLWQVCWKSHDDERSSRVNTSEEPRHLASDAAAWLQVLSTTPQGALPFLFGIFFSFISFSSPLGGEWKNLRKVETKLSWCWPVVERKKRIRQLQSGILELEEVP